MPKEEKIETSFAKSSFEGSLEKLQSIVKKLESGELTLEDSLKQFEEGVQATRECQKFLSDAEAKIEILTKN